MSVQVVETISAWAGAATPSSTAEVKAASDERTKERRPEVSSLTRVQTSTSRSQAFLRSSYLHLEAFAVLHCGHGYFLNRCKRLLHHYLIVWTFPTVEGAWESCPGFADYINSGAPGDKFDGFELKYRVCEPVSGSGVAIAEASDIGKVWAHLGPWIKGYGIEFDVTAVVSDAQFASMWRGVEAAAAVE